MNLRTLQIRMKCIVVLLIWTCLLTTTNGQSSEPDVATQIEGTTTGEPSDLLGAETHSLRYDFRWSANLHRTIDLLASDDQRGLASELQEWELESKNVTDTDRYERDLLVKLVRKSRSEIASNIETLLRADSISWSLLLAIEQIDLRLGPKNSSLRKKIDHELLARAERVIQAYKKHAVRNSELGFLISASTSRISNDKDAVRLLNLALKSQAEMGHSAEFVLIVMHAERLYRLALLNKIEFAASAKKALSKLCEHVLSEPIHLKKFPLALAKSRHALATIEDDETLKLKALRLATDACDAVIVSENAIPSMWRLEANRLQISPLDLFGYRSEKLKSTILTDGYKLVSKMKAQTEETSFSAQRLENSLSQLVELQSKVYASEPEKLSTLIALAASIRAHAKQRLGAGPEVQSVLDQAKKIADKLMSDQAINSDLHTLCLEAKLLWIEQSVHATSGPSHEPSVSFSRDLYESIKHLKPLVQNNFHFRERLIRADALRLLNGDDYDLIHNLVSELESQESALGEDQFVILFLKTMLAKQVGNLHEASQLACSLSFSVHDSILKKAISLYVKSELQVEQGFHSVDPILDLYNLLQSSSVESIQNAILTSIRNQNDFHLATAAAFLESKQDESKQDDNSHAVRQKLFEAMTTRVREFDSKTKDLLYRRIWLAQANNPENTGTQVADRAKFALASDQFQRLNRKSQASNKPIEFLQERYRQEFSKYSTEVIELDKTLEKLIERKASLERPQAKQQFDVQLQKYEQDFELYTKQRKANEANQKQLMREYDAIFQTTGTSTVLTSNDLESLRIDLEQLVPFVVQKKSISKFPNLAYNIRCLLLNAELSFPTACPKREDWPTILENCAKDAIGLALKLRSRWKREPSETRAISRDDSRNRLFDRYQLAFELALRLAVKENRLPRAMFIAALTTNRSFNDLSQEYQDNDSSEHFLNPYFIDSVEQFNSSLPKQFIAYFCGNHSLHVFWRLDSGKIRHSESNVNRAGLNNVVESLRVNYATEQSRRDVASSQLLANWSIPLDLREDLVRHDKDSCVYVAPHGSLFSIPLEGLPIDVGSTSTVLAQICPFIYVPTLLPSRTAQDDSADVTSQYPMAILTVQPNPRYGNESIVIEQIAKETNKAVTRIAGPNATKEIVRSLLEKKWEIVHFGTHGKGAESLNLSSAQPVERIGAALIELYGTDVISSAELLSIAGLPSIKNSKSGLDIRFVFLSACETQVTDRSDLLTGGNTLKTLGTSFLAAGAEAVVPSYWEVDSDATEELFTDVFDRWSKLKSEASIEDMARILRDARLTLRDKQADRPHRWNAFTIWTKVIP